MNIKDYEKPNKNTDSSEDQFAIDDIMNKKFENMQQTSGQGSVTHDSMHDVTAKTAVHSKHPDKRKGTYPASRSHSQDADRHHGTKHQISDK